MLHILFKKMKRHPPSGSPTGIKEKPCLNKLPKPGNCANISCIDSLSSFFPSNHRICLNIYMETYPHGYFS